MEDITTGRKRVSNKSDKKPLPKRKAINKRKLSPKQSKKHSNHTKGDTEMSDQPPAPIKIPEITPNQQENASSNENKIQNEAPAPTPVPTPTPSYSHPNPFESGFGDIFKSNLSYGLENLSKNSKARNQIQTYLTGLQSDDETTQLQSLFELSDFLSISTEETLGVNFAVEEFVGTLVNLLHYDHNPEIMLLATRCLTYLIEANPKFSKSIVTHFAIPIFCEKLLSIQYIDVAEQCIQALEKLSIEHSVDVLKSDGLVALLSYLEFFSVSVQRSCVDTASNLCRNVPEDLFHNVSSVLPLLSNLLLNSDPKIVNSAIVCFQRLSKCFQSSKEKIEIISAEGIVEHLIKLLTSATPAGIIDNSGSILNILEIIAKRSPTSIISMLNEGLSPILKNLLVAEQNTAHTPTPSTKLYSDVLAVAHEFLPSLPKHVSPIIVVKDKYVIPQPSTPPSSTLSVPPSTHETLFHENLSLFLEFSQSLYGPVKNAFNSNINPYIRSKCLSIILKFIYFIPSDKLVNLLRDMDTSAFVASLLASNRLAYVATAIRLADVMMQKLPDIFSKYFKREGVLYQIDKLSSDSTILPSNLDDSTRDIKTWIHEQANHFKSKYFPLSAHPGQEGEVPVFATEEMEKLKKLIKNLNKKENYGNEEKEREILKGIVGMLIMGVSTFEFERSELVGGLLEYLTNVTPPFQHSMLVQRWRLFYNEFANPIDRTSAPSASNKVPLRLLIQSLQNSLVQNERFIVLLNDIHGTGSGLKFLTQPLKLKLIRDESSKDLQEYQGGVITVEPLASITAVEDYLWNKVKPLKKSSTERKSKKLRKKKSKKERVKKEIQLGGGETKGKSENKTTEEEAASKEPEAEPEGNQEGEKMEEEEEEEEEINKQESENKKEEEKAAEQQATQALLEEDDVIIDDHNEDTGLEYNDDQDMVDDINLSLQSSSSQTNEKAKEAEKKQEEDVEEEEEIKFELQQRSKEEERAHNLELILERGTNKNEGKKLRYKNSLFQELQINYNENINENKLDSVISSTAPAQTIWDAEHMITYKSTRRHSKKSMPEIGNSCKWPVSEESEEAGKRIIEFNENLILSILKNQKKPEGLSDKMQISSFIEEILNLLEFLFYFTRFYREDSYLQYQENKLNTATPLNPFLTIENEFINSKLTVKLTRQLQDALTVCSTELPIWCNYLVCRYPFLFSFDSRKQFFTSTSLGIARGLHCLQENLFSQLSNDHFFSSLHSTSSNSLHSSSSSVDTSSAPSSPSPSSSRRSDNQSNQQQAQQFRIGRIQRQKVRVSRNQILQCACKVIELYCRSKSVLEVEFFGEVGTGLGPTLEFYTIISHQLQRKDLYLWCHDSTYQISSENFDYFPTASSTAQSNVPSPMDESKSSKKKRKSYEYLFNAGGLYPAPLKASDPHFHSILNLFQFFGCFMAKAIVDDRVLDISLAPTFFKWLIKKKEYFTIYDVVIIYPAIGQTLIELSAIYDNYQKMLLQNPEQVSLPKETILATPELLYKSTTLIDELGFYFISPVRNDWDLLPGGSNKLVTTDNVGEYIQLVINHLLVDGIASQMKSFLEGFQQVLSLDTLYKFSISDLDTLICGWNSTSNDYWEQHAILESIVCDHQYSLDSQPVQYFAKAISELSNEDKKNFLLFVTGSPKLPIGGFKNLKPRLTVVRKETTDNPDEYLPSVMTCVNYVKLPAYSSVDVLKERLLLAIREGLSSFHLS